MRTALVVNFRVRAFYKRGRQEKKLLQRLLVRRVQFPVHVAFFGLSFRRPSRTRLSAVATRASSFEYGAQPSTRLAFSLVAFFTLPSSGTINFTAGSRMAARRTSQFGNSRVGTLFAEAPLRFFRTLPLP